jgi:hypothetical protein
MQTAATALYVERCHDPDMAARVVTKNAFYDTLRLLRGLNCSTSTYPFPFWRNAQLPQGYVGLLLVMAAPRSVLPKRLSLKFRLSELKGSPVVPYGLQPTHVVLNEVINNISFFFSHSSSGLTPTTHACSCHEPSGEAC